MFNLICVLIIACIGGVGLFVPVEDVKIIGIVILCISGVWFFVSFVNNLVKHTDMVKKFEEIRANLKKLEIYKEKQRVLISEFTIYLADKYPDFEKEIFKLITDSKSDINVFLKYPELKSSETIMELVKQINNQSAATYNYKVELENEYAAIRFYNMNKWFYIKVQTPSDILEHL